MINMIELINKKKQGEALSDEEIRGFVSGVTDGSIPDYQTSALLMAIIFQGMSKQETFTLTDAMLHSGEVVDLSAIPGVKVDKHSTGGVGDKTSLIVAPLASACGVKIAKMSGRGLGFTGGTVDKMESIPGFRVELSPEEFLNAVNESGMAIIGQSADVAPADKKLYALRDVTGTVDNISLISSSIMSKKLASGSDAIVLDVKCGKGAFMKTLEDAEELGSMLVEIGNNAGKKTIACISDMDQPLGKAVGNSLEVIEAIETLKGRGPGDITELALTLSGYMVYAGGMAISPEDGKKKTTEALYSGKGLEQLKKFIKSQGGDPSCTEDYSLFKQPIIHGELVSPVSGYINRMVADEIGLASQELGAGRKTKEDPIDYSAGIVLNKKLGEWVEKGEKLADMYTDSEEKLESAKKKAIGAYVISKEKPEASVLIKKIIE